MQIPPASIAGAAALFLTAVALHAQSPLPFQNPDAPLEARITDLLARMTLEEKMDFWHPADVPRLASKARRTSRAITVGQGGPSIGPAQPDPTTHFRRPNGLGATWDPELIAGGRGRGDRGALPFPKPKYKPPASS